MKIFRNKFIRSTGIYFMGSVASKMIVFLMLPLYTAYIPPQDFGMYDLYVSIATIVLYCVCFDIWTAVMRYMYDEESIEGKKKVITNGGVITLLALIVYLLVFLLINTFIQIEYITLIICYGIATLGVNFYSFTARGYGKNKIYVISGTVATVVNILTNIILIVVFDFDYSALYYSSIIAFIVQIAILELKCNIIKGMCFKYISIIRIKEMLRFGIPLAFNAIAYWILSSFNKAVVTMELGPEYNGYYAAATRFGVAITLFSSCIQFAWQDKVFSESSEKVDYSRQCSIYVYILAATSILLIPFIKVIFPYMVGITYTPALSIIPAMVISTIFSVFSSFLGEIFSGIKKTTGLLYTSIFAAVVNVFVVYCLINVIGLNAANLAMLAGFGASIILRYIMINRYVKLQFKYKIFLLFYIPILAVTIQLFYNSSVVINLIYLIVLAIASSAYLFFKYKNEIFGDIASGNKVIKLFEKFLFARK